VPLMGKALCGLAQRDARSSETGETVLPASSRQLAAGRKKISSMIIAAR